MSKIARGFTRLAPVYDWLARIAIGSGIRTSQYHFISYIKGSDRVLMLGGGTGWLLAQLKQIHTELKVDYIDISPGMIQKAQKATSPYGGIQFITGTEQSIPYDQYDVVITNFYLDLFESHELKSITQKIYDSVLPGGLWLATDFVDDTRWKRILLWMMYRFFSLTTRLSASRLPDWQGHLYQVGARPLVRASFTQGFINATVWKCKREP